jgi:hypothetical protein
MQAVNTPLLRFWCQQLKTYDCDPALYMMQYLFHRFEFNTEQKYWLCWLFANTYHLPTAWVMWTEFPDFENVGVDRLRQWELANKARLPYQKDQKWLRGRLADNFLAYQENVYQEGDCTDQEHYWHMMGDHFPDAWSHLLSPRFPRFGRYTAWFYLQALNECCGHKFVAPSLFLKDPSSKQPREGLMMASGFGDIESLESFASDLVVCAQEILAGETLPVQPDRFSLETSLCAWSKMPRGSSKGRYLGYYLDRVAEDINNTAKHDWSGIHWGALWESRNEILLPEMVRGAVAKDEMAVFPATGKFSANPVLLSQFDRWFENQLATSCL